MVGCFGALRYVGNSKSGGLHDENKCIFKVPAITPDSMRSLRDGQTIEYRVYVTVRLKGGGGGGRL